MRFYNSGLSNALLKAQKIIELIKNLGLDVLKFSVKFENKK